MAEGAPIRPVLQDTPLSPFDNPTIHLTSHDNNTGKAIIHSSTRNPWLSLRSGALGFNNVYTTSSFPVSLTNNEDIRKHEELLGTGKLGLVNPGGTVCRIVEFAPNAPAHMHRTQSLDYGIVLEGEVLMTLDGGEEKHLKRGDIAVQRGTMHAWKSASDTNWARMLFVLTDCHPVEVAGQVLHEDLQPGWKKTVEQL